MALHLVYRFFKIVMFTFALVAQVMVSPLLETIVKIVTKLPTRVAKYLEWGFQQATCHKSQLLTSMFP